MPNASRSPATWLGWAFAAGLLAAAAYVVLKPAPAMPPEAMGTPPEAMGTLSRSSPGANGVLSDSSPGAMGAGDVPCEMCRVPSRWAASKVAKAPDDNGAKAPNDNVAQAPGDNVAQAPGEIAPQDANDSHAAGAARPEVSDRVEHRAAATEQVSVAQEPAGAAREPQAERPASLMDLHPGARVDNVMVRDHGDRVMLRGAIELGPTLERIDAGRRLEFPDDGIVFQNRERRLPHQPRGYYHEYVIPTGGLSGPGPQRVVVGSGGEVFYSPDHYRTFRRIP